MSLRAYPKVASAGSVRVWVGTRSSPRLPALSFQLDGAPATPRAVRAMQSVRPASMVDNPAEPRAYSGVFEFSGLPHDSRHEVRVSADTEPGLAVARMRTLPARLSDDAETWFNVLVSSCYYTGGDHARHLRECVAALPAQLRPHVCLLSGDQVYLDLPTFENFQDNTAWLAARFERTYADNWFGEDLTSLLTLAPSVCIPDDHEYWNNFPHASPFVGNTHSAGGRARWHAAAAALFSGFQLGPPDHLGAPAIFDVPPLSFFVADTRSFRSSSLECTLHPNALAWLRSWAQRVRNSGLYGVFVSGQSLFEGAAGSFAGNVADRAMANYRDYGAIFQALGSVASGGRCLLCVTGDVHWGRVCYAFEAASGVPRAFEVICSPASLVDSPWDAGNRLLHGGDWPLHGGAAAPPGALSVGNERWKCSTLHAQKGDQMAILSFRRFAGAVQVKVSYWPIHARASARRATLLSPFSLRATE